MPTALITGANRGLGLEFARQYLLDGWDVIATCRDPNQADELNALGDTGSLRIEALDVTNAEAIEELTSGVTEPLDLLLNNAGMIGPVPVAEHIQRQHFGSIDYELWMEVLQTNTFAPVRLAERLIEQIAASDHKKIITLSSTVGSIVERDTPAMAYATSKTALNKAMTLLASELRERGIIVGLICPGYVKTRMDFGTADVEPPESVAGVRSLIDHYTLADSGTFRRYNGETISW